MCEDMFTLCLGIFWHPVQRSFYTDFKGIFSPCLKTYLHLVWSHFSFCLKTCTLFGDKFACLEILESIEKPVKSLISFVFQNFQNKLKKSSLWMNIFHTNAQILCLFSCLPQWCRSVQVVLNWDLQIIVVKVGNVILVVAFIMTSSFSSWSSNSDVNILWWDFTILSSHQNFVTMGVNNGAQNI